MTSGPDSFSRPVKVAERLVPLGKGGCVTEVMRVLVWVGWSKYPRMRPEQSMTYLGGRVVALLCKGFDCLDDINFQELQFHGKHMHSFNMIAKRLK